MAGTRQLRPGTDAARLPSPTQSLTELILPLRPQHSPTTRAVDLKLGSKGQRPLPSSRRMRPTSSCARVKFSTLCREADGRAQGHAGECVGLEGKEGAVPEGGGEAGGKPPSSSSLQAGALCGGYISRSDHRRDATGFRRSTGMIQT